MVKHDWRRHDTRGWPSEPFVLLAFLAQERIHAGKAPDTNSEHPETSWF
jgi:hypothetical protein